MSDDRIRVDVAGMTLLEQAEAADVLEAHGLSTEGAGAGLRNVVALAYVLRRRTDPSYTWDDASRLGMADIDLVVDSPEALAADNGGAPQPLPVSGT